VVGLGALTRDFFRANWISYTIGILLLLVSTTLNTNVPKYLGFAIDALEVGNVDPSAARYYAIMMAVLAFLSFITRLFWRMLLIGNSRKIEFFARERFFAKLQSLPVSFYTRNKTGDLISRAISDIQSLRQLYGMAFVNSIDAVLISSISLAFMIESMDLFTTFIVIMPLPIIIIALSLLRLTLRKRFVVVQQTIAAISERVQENTMGIRILKGFAQERFEQEAFAGLSNDKTAAEMKRVNISALMPSITQLAFGVSFSIFLVQGARFVAHGEMALGTYVAVNGYIALIMRPVRQVSRIVEIWQRGSASIERLNMVFNEPWDEDEGTDTSITTLRPSIKISNLTFSYTPELPQVLRNVSIDLPAGKVLGIMGGTGSGKTTLANLLCKLYPAPEGTIRVDGHDITKIPSGVLRNSIGYVPQDGFLFSDTVHGNVRFYAPGTTDEMAEEATKLSLIYDDIIAFPEGFHTICGERGVTLSGGQKQRIAIARALVKNPSIVLLDDCLSAVDTTTEAGILHNLKEFTADRTTIIISHRISTLKHADEIVFLEDGAIVERGTHEQLLDLNGRYAELLREQQAQDSRTEVPSA